MAESSFWDARAASLDWGYNQAANANVYNFVTVKLSGHENYEIWHAQMMYLLDVYHMRWFVDNYAWYCSKSPAMSKLYDNLLKGWVFSSIDQQVLKRVSHCSTAVDTLFALQKLYGQTNTTAIPGSSNADADAARLEELEYNQALNANVSNFITVKLSGHENYDIWHAQMMCLVDVYDMRGLFVRYHAWSKSKEIEKRYDNLLMGWVISSIDQQVLKRVSHCSRAGEIISELEKLYAPIKITAEADLPRRDCMLMDVSPNDNKSFKLKMKLLNATMEGNWWKAEAILKNNENAATMEINNNGDTMLHLAVNEGKNYFVKQLLNFIKDGSEIKIFNLEGHTALHTAVIVDNKQAAELLVNKSKELLYVSIRYRTTYHIPLALAYTRGQINTFLYLLGVTSNGLGSLHSNLGVHHLLAKATSTKQYNLALKLVKIPELLALATENDKTLMALTTDFPPELVFWEALIYPSSDGVRRNIVKRSSLLLYSFKDLYIKAHDILWAIRNLKNTYLSWLLLLIVLILLVPVAVFCLIYLLICIVIFVLLLPLFMLYPHLWKGLVYAGLPIKHIEKKKRDYDEAKKVLLQICNVMNTKVHQSNYDKLYSGPLLEAARVDACEVVVQILRGFEYAQISMNERRHDVFQLAILNRSEKIYNRLSPGIKRSDFLRQTCDSSENLLTHLAAKLASSIVLSRTTGAALQLQQELQWHEEVKKLMLPIELTYKNAHMETSDMVFTREHADLLKEGEQWIKTTAESCSITAALIVTIVFAAAITVPGGSNQETGIPLFKKEIAFTIFAVCDALSLFTAATALLIFLSILTTRFAAKDFLVSLPRRLIIGLCALFISTTAMMVAFGAILFLVFCDQRPWMLAPIGLFTCLPISVIVTLQLPLLADLFQSTYISRFDKPKFH